MGLGLGLEVDPNPNLTLPPQVGVVCAGMCVITSLDPMPTDGLSGALTTDVVLG